MNMVVPVRWLNRQVVRKGAGGSFKEDDHPRDKAGRFMDKDEIEEAKGDPEKADELRDKVRPKDAGKLEKQIGGAKGEADADHFAVVFKDHAGQEWGEKDSLDKRIGSLRRGVARQLGDDADVDGVLHHAAHHARQIIDTVKRQGGKPGEFNLDYIFNTAVQRAIDAELKARKTEAFANDYFDQDDADDRVSSFMENFVLGKAIDRMDPDELPDEVREAVYEDLAAWSADAGEKASVFSDLIDNYGGDSDHAMIAAVRESLERSAPSPKPFDRENASNYAVYDLSGLEAEQKKNAIAFLTAAGVVPIATEPDVYVVDNSGADSPADYLANSTELGEGIEVAPLDGDGNRDLFEKIKSPPTVGEHQAPASSRNTGTVSGGKDGGTAVEDDWDSNNVDVYKRLDRGTYLVRRGANSPIAADRGSRYEYVPASEAPVQVRLPDQYWRNDTPQDDDAIDHDAAERVANKDSGKLSTDRKKLDAAMAGHAATKKRHGELKQRHNTVVGKNGSFEKTGEKLATLFDDFERSSSIGDEDQSEEHTEAMSDLHDELAELHDHYNAYRPDLPDFDLDLGVPGDKHLAFESRGEQAEHVDDTVNQFHAEADDAESAIADAETEHKKHATEGDEMWSKIAETARKAVQSAAGSDDEQVRENGRAAARVLLAAKAHLRKAAKRK